MLSEVTHISILPYTRVFCASGVTGRKYADDPQRPERGQEYIRALPDNETPTTIYDGVLE